ncbi:MAG: ATP-binding cassette domain-containing protein [Verrucomicrobia bacterium]|nr:ATP-binding cassette domain-containing protein [Verrucomicrobiota bacterium]MBU4247786.1 ATP-binding cassette domain-containing protein [Verrucomicrobiota bacterium]MBU4292074.1 ATP-binding cassette domain-containing protein [Verrucomicrobiota bacterium]MBU4427853.1 ATP-binding cassette domain-containing protein [Verrucomicrobiota bacterium]MBU4497664.1 ATP-binding cassette domain-containing protein [Verrucomicrobiota bacterium]
MIQVSHLTKRFASTVAIDDVSFEVQRGEIVGFLGPNGAGKTTTMRILTGYLAATEGRVFIDGLDVFLQSLEVRRRIGYLPETVPLYPELRVDEYLTFRARLKGVPRRKLRARLEDVKEMCGLNDVARRIIGQLSRGYWQRVGLADSLIHDPELLILDEPTIGLDPNQIRAVRELIRNLGRRYTILLSTHILSEAEMVCQRVMILHRGKIIASDSPAALMGLFQGNPCVVAEIFGPRDAVLPQLKNLAGVARVSCQVGSEPLAGAGSLPAWNRFRIEAVRDEEARAAVFDMVAQNRWALRELSVEKRNLEDVFVHMTAQGETNGDNP